MCSEIFYIQSVLGLYKIFSYWIAISCRKIMREISIPFLKDFVCISVEMPHLPEQSHISSPQNWCNFSPYVQFPWWSCNKYSKTRKWECSGCGKDRQLNCFLPFEEAPLTTPHFSHLSQVLPKHYPLTYFPPYSFFWIKVRKISLENLACRHQTLVPTSGPFLQASKGTVTQSVHLPSQLDFPLPALQGVWD